MKKITALLLSLCLILCAGFVLNSCKGGEKETADLTDTVSETITETETESTTLNIVEKDSVEAACEATGIESVTIPDGITPTGYGVLDETIIQIEFDGGYMRKSFQYGDISGDTNIYTRANVKKVGDYAVTMKGNDGKVMLAFWADTQPLYTYCIYFEDGVTETEMREYIMNFK